MGRIPLGLILLINNSCKMRENKVKPIKVCLRRYISATLNIFAKTLYNIFSGFSTVAGQQRNAHFRKAPRSSFDSQDGIALREEFILGKLAQLSAHR